MVWWKYLEKGSVVVNSLVYVPSIVCGGSVFDLCFWYALLCILILQLSC